MFAGILQVEVLFHPFFVVFFAGIVHVHELSLPPQTGLSLCVFLSMRTLSVCGLGFGFGERERGRKKRAGDRELTEESERERENEGETSERESEQEETEREREMERGDARGN